MKRKVSFMFINAAIEDAIYNVIDLGQAEMIIVGVSSYDMAKEEAEKLSNDGVILIELCGGFGTIGQAEVAKSVGKNTKVGAVRFDNHPGYEGLSGDEKWM